MGVVIFLMYAAVLLGDALLIGFCGPFWVIYLFFLGISEGEISMIILSIIAGIVSIPFVYFAIAVATDIFNFVIR